MACIEGGGKDATRPTDSAARNLRAEDRLAKTLLLAALVPEVDVLKSLTADPSRRPESRVDPDAYRGARRPGGVAALPRLGRGDRRGPDRRRSGQSDHHACSSRRSTPRASSPTPTATTTPGTAGARSGSILFRELGIEDRGKLLLHHEIFWRGTPRRFEVIFANVRELPDESLDNPS